MSEIIRTNIGLFLGFMNDGGSAMWILFSLNLLLWYSLGVRQHILKRWTRHNVRSLVQLHETPEAKREIRELMDMAIVDALSAAREARDLGLKPRHHIMDALSPHFRSINTYSVLVKAIVVIAPLIGLLGTVSGMIEAFDALQTSAMFAQGASISGGISKALFTTELGLVVAVPGLIIGRSLDQKADTFVFEFDQVADIISTKED